LSRSPQPIETVMIWPRRFDNQPAHAWLRDVISDAAKAFRAT
jgi:DNA-binding transcriptional LysR family regulator